METVERLKIHSIVVDNKAVGERIRQIRESLPGKPNQSKFYEILNGTDDSGKLVDKWENGRLKNGPDLQNLARIAAVGHVSIEWLLTGKGKGISPTMGDSSPTLRDYCELLFVDMPRRFGMTWKTPARLNMNGWPIFNKDDSGIYFYLPLASHPTDELCETYALDGGYFSSPYKLLECAEHMQAVQSLPANTRRMVEKDLLSKVPAVPVPPLDDDSKPL